MSPFTATYLDRLNSGLDPKGDRPLRKIEDLVIRPSEDLGRIAADVVRDDTDLEMGTFLRILRRATGAGSTAKEADLMSYLLFDAAYARPLAELGYKDAEAHQDELAAFFSNDD